MEEVTMPFLRVTSLSGCDQALGFWCEPCGTRVVFPNHSSGDLELMHCGGEIARYEDSIQNRGSLKIVSAKSFFSIGRTTVNAMKPAKSKPSQPVTDHTRQRIAELSRRGKNYSYISAVLNVPKKQVVRVLKRDDPNELRH